MTITAKIIRWRDILVIVDDGHISVAEYENMETVVKAEADQHPGGLGCLVIIPPGASPPPAHVRRHIDGMLDRLPMRCLAYVVEGRGFRAATTRAALIGMRVFQRKSYSTKVAGSVDEALVWLFTGLGGAHTRERDLASASKAIADGRRATS